MVRGRRCCRCRNRSRRKTILKTRPPTSPSQPTRRSASAAAASGRPKAPLRASLSSWAICRKSWNKRSTATLSATDVQLPVTINGRIFPHQNVDAWAFALHKGQSVACEVNAARLGSPLDSYLEVIDPDGHTIAENDDALGADSLVRFTAATDGKYTVRIRDANGRGGPTYVYRLTLTSDPHLERAFPLGGRRGEATRFTLYGQGAPPDAVEIKLPADGPHDYRWRLTRGDGKAANPLLLDLDDLPEIMESEPNNQPAQANKATLPAMLNGRIAAPGDVDWWSFTAHKGETLRLELRAQQLGSPLQGVLTVCDALGKELAHGETGVGQPDPVMTFAPPTDGDLLRPHCRPFSHARRT